MRCNVIIAFCLAGCLLVSVMGGASAQNVTTGKNATGSPTAMNMTSPAMANMTSPTMANTTDSDMIMNTTTMTNTTSAKNSTKAGSTTTKAGNTTCMSVAEYLTASNTTVGPELAKLVKPGFNGTVFVPTDKALTAVLDSILAAASKEANKTITELPLSTDALFILPELQDVLKLHIVPDMAIDPKTLNATDFDGADALEATVNKTLLSSVTKQSLCPNTTKSPLTVSIVATLKPAYKLGKVSIMSPGSNATVVNATVGMLCDGVVHMIDAVLLPCNTNQSVIPKLAKDLAALANVSVVPGINITTNGTRGITLNGTTNTTGNGNAAPAVGMNIGTMLAAMCAVMIMSGTTSYTLIAALTVIVGGVLTVATM